jgi:hypothetical protein
MQNKIVLDYYCTLQLQTKNQRNLLLQYIRAINKRNDCLWKIKLVLRSEGNCKYLVSIFQQLKIFTFNF